MKSKGHIILLSIVLEIFLSACGQLPYHPASTLGQLNENDICIKNICILYPVKFKLLQRVVLTIKEKQYDFMVYAVLERPESLRVVAFAEIGGILFDLRVTEKGDREIIKKSRWMPEKYLKEGFLEDYLHIYGIQRFKKTHLIARNNVDVSIVTYPIHHMIREYHFLENCTRLTYSLEAYKNRVYREVEYHNYRKYDGLIHELPSYIILNNRHLKYKMELQLLKFELL